MKMSQDFQECEDLTIKIGMKLVFTLSSPVQLKNVPFILSRYLITSFKRGH